MELNDDVFSESSFLKYKTKYGPVGQLLRQARKSCVFIRHQKIKKKNGKVARYYKKDDVFDWLKNDGVEYFELKRPIFEEKPVKINSFLLEKKYQEVEEKHQKLKNEFFEFKELFIETKKKLESFQLGVDNSGLLNLGEILKRAVDLNTICGIYFLIDKDEIVYVGQSVNVHARIANHINENVKQFDRYVFIEFEKDQLNRYEREYYDKFKPKYNIQTPPNIVEFKRKE